jgi:hypothetical protein
MIEGETRLDQAERHVFEGRRIVDSQRLFIEWGKRVGLDIRPAEDKLRAIERSQSTLEDNLAAIRREVAP